MDSPQPFLMEISPQPAPVLDSILKLSGCGHLPPFEGCPSGPRREAWLRPGWFRIDPIFRGPTVGGQSCHPYPTPTGWTLPGEGLCQGSTAAVTEAELQGPPSSISHQGGCWAGRRPASLTSAGAGQGPCFPGDPQAWLFHHLQSQNHPCHHFLGESRLYKILYKGTQLIP